VAPEDDWYWQNAVSAGQVGRRDYETVCGFPLIPGRGRYVG